MSDAMAILRREFDAEDGSFLLRLRCDLIWDRAAFTRLTTAMLAACRATEGRREAGSLDGGRFLVYVVFRPRLVE